MIRFLFYIGKYFSFYTMNKIQISHWQSMISGYGNGV